MAEDTQEKRRSRLAELAAVLGGDAELGRKLGYNNGAFIGQMISGRRAITEKTVAKAEAIRDARLPGGSARGWFAEAQAQRDLLELDVAAVPKDNVLADGNVPTTAKSLIAQIAFVMEGMDESGRRLAVEAFSALALDPRQRARAEFILAGAMVSVPHPPDPPATKPKKKVTPGKASLARKPTPPKLEVRPGGGQRSLIERIGIKPLKEVVLDEYASEDEKRLYGRFANYPKASDKEH